MCKRFRKTIYLLALLGVIAVSFNSCYMHRHQYNSGYNGGYNSGYNSGGGHHR